MTETNKASLQHQLDELQAQLSFQENTIAGLNDVVTAQQEDICLLKQQIKVLVQQLELLSAGDSAGNPSEQKPPHY